jgi:porin
MAFGSLKSVLIATSLMAAAGGSVLAQDATGVRAQPDTPSAAARSLEDLNMRGGDVAMPPFSDSVIDVNSAERQQPLKHGLAIREIIQLQFVQNILEAPVAADQQVYVGQRAFTSAMSNPILTWDMRQLGLQHSQLNVSGIWQWVSWEPAGPNAFDLWTLYFFKAFAADRVEIKAGYNSNDLEFVGMQVGGSTASGVQGVYAVLPYEVGMAFFPLPAPQFNLKIKGPDCLYLKSGVQRSLDAAGGPADEARNHTGLRFDPKGDKLLIIEEGGFRREASATKRETWFRAGYLRNSTLYTDMSSGKQEPGNSAAYALFDTQLRKPAPDAPWHGLYLGGSAMAADSKFNAFDRYYEARLYQMGTFRKRPGDVVSLLSTYTGHSKYLTDALVAKGSTVWRNGASVTGSYNIHLAPGNYLSLGLSYIHGAAITPKVNDALTFAAVYSVFF